jgi:hypothetical protein
MARTRTLDEPVPSIGALMGNGPRWFWAYCLNKDCGRGFPMALAPFAVRWGLDTSSDTIRRSVRCACGHKGVELRHPSWCGSQREWQPFPTPVGARATSVR